MSITARYFIDLIDVQCINIQRIRMMWYNDDENDDVQEFFLALASIQFLKEMSILPCNIV